MTVETLRGKPRIYLYNGGEYRDLDNYLDIDPHATMPRVSVQRSVTSRVQTQTQKPYTSIRLRQQDVSRADADFWRRVYHDQLVHGDSIAVIRDRTRFFCLTGEDRTGREQRMGILPSTSTGMFPITHGSKFAKGALSGQGALAYYDFDAYDLIGRSSSRNQLFPDGDFMDSAYGSLMSGWVNVYPSNLTAVTDVWLRPRKGVQLARFTADTGATTSKQVYRDFDIGVALSTVNDLVVSWMQRMDGILDTATNAMVIKLKDPGGSDELTLYDGTPSTDWEWNAVQADISSWAGSGTSLRLEITFAATQRLFPISITEISVVEDLTAMPFIPYSTTRGETGIPEGDDWDYLCLLGPFYATPANINSERFAFTVSMWATPMSPGAASQYLGEIFKNGSNVLEHISGSNNTDFQVMTDDGTLEILNMTQGAGTVLTPEHWLASWIDDSTGSAGDGEMVVYRNGTLVGSKTHSAKAVFYDTLRMSGEGNMNGVWFNHYVIDPVFVADGGDTSIASGVYPVSDYYNTSAPTVAQGRLRNAWRCVLDERHRGEPVTVSGNRYELDLRLEERPWF